MDQETTEEQDANSRELQVGKELKKEALVFSHYFFLNYRCSLGACRQHRVTLHRNIKCGSK